jgi:hypothetical protein
VLDEASYDKAQRRDGVLCLCGVVAKSDEKFFHVMVFEMKQSLSKY